MAKRTAIWITRRAPVFLLFLLFIHPPYSENDCEPSLSGAEELQRFHREIRTPDDASGPSYRPGHLMRELNQARYRNRLMRKNTAAGVIEWRERGPNNVAGRIRGLAIDPSDASHKTWYAGSASGGVWKTTDAGLNWTLITPDLPNLATTVVTIAPSNPDVIYLGTGEGFGNLDGVTGSGLFKSTDRGNTWSWLSQTSDFMETNRIIVDPASADKVVAATNSGIYRSTDGGQTWNLTLDRSGIQDLDAAPNNFNIQYATENGFGIYKSTDGGLTWTMKNTGLFPEGRTELSISPVNNQTLYASAEGSVTGPGADLYRSDNGAESWHLVNVEFNENRIDFLGGQGWYDNSILADPFNTDVVYLGGVNVFRVASTNNITNITTRNLLQDGTNFLQLVNFTNATNGNYSLGSFAGNTDIEVRFGPGKSQFAHRFLVPEGATAGVPDANYTYQDFVNVPFEVWDTDRNIQLTVSFRDQDRNGQFNLRPENTMGSSLEQSREYVYIQDVPYNPNAAVTAINVAGGQTYRQMIFFWPVLAAGKTWPDDITTSKIAFQFSSIPIRTAVTSPATDAYGTLNGRNRFITYGVDMHPDQHNFVPIQTGTNTYQVLAANDGGIFLTSSAASPGLISGDWSMRGVNLRVTQFYGADKRPGAEQFFGGTQDNGTWISPDGTAAKSTSNYRNGFGGDGFYVLWNQADGNKLIGGSQYNGLQRSINGGLNWAPATSGLSGTHPFITRLSGSEQRPDRIYTVSSDGVFRSVNFGQGWTLSPITQNWGTGSALNVEVSRADDEVIWAGSGMSSSGTMRNLHVSLDGGQTFTATTNYNQVVMGSITRLATHPTERSTAFALFSFAGKPKVLRTTDMGQTWTDLSGMVNGAPSTNGFPDVAVFSLIVHRKNPQVIWVGTELGLVESTDGGASWSLVEDFPKVPIWDLKERDNVIVLATHGRGIWTAALDRYEQTIQFAAGDTDLSKGSVQFNGTSTSGLPLTYSSPDTDKISINGNQVTLLASGVVTITASQEGNNVYKSATTVTLSFCIRPTRPVITSGGEPGVDLKLTTDIDPPLNWYRDGKEIQGATGKELAVEESGNYSVRYTRNGCTSESIAFPVVITAIATETVSKLQVWPNPAAGLVRFCWESAGQNDSYRLSIADATGREICQQIVAGTCGQIETDLLPSGYYVLTAMQGRMKARARLIRR